MDTNKRSEVDDLFSQGDLTNLVDLQKFLADELGAAEGPFDVSRAFTPLTDGLGIHDVAKRGTSSARTPTTSMGAVQAGPAAFSLPLTEEVTELRVAQAPKPPRVNPLSESLETVLEAAPPPPVPTATFSRRLFAGVVDQCFIWTAWLVTLLITSKAMGVGQGELSLRFAKELNNPLFLQSAGLQFAVIWLAYLTVCIGFLEMTFGMWVWGLKLGFGTEARFWKKLARIVLGMFFYLPVLPTLLFVFRKNNAHLVDGLTRSHVYRVC